MARRTKRSLGFTQSGCTTCMRSVRLRLVSVSLVPWSVSPVLSPWRKGDTRCAVVLQSVGWCQTAVLVQLCALRSTCGPAVCGDSKKTRYSTLFLIVIFSADFFIGDSTRKFPCTKFHSPHTSVGSGLSICQLFGSTRDEPAHHMVQLSFSAVGVVVAAGIQNPAEGAINWFVYRHHGPHPTPALYFPVPPTSVTTSTY